MTATFFIKPASEAIVVKDPVSKVPLKAEGETKPRNSYWLRRVADKDVVVVEPSAE